MEKLFALTDALLMLLCGFMAVQGIMGGAYFFALVETFFFILFGSFTYFRFAKKTKFEIIIKRKSTD